MSTKKKCQNFANSYTLITRIMRKSKIDIMDPGIEGGADVSHVQNNSI